MISESMKSFFNEGNARAVRMSAVSVTVEVNSTVLVNEMGENLYKEFVRMCPHANYEPISTLTSEDVCKYLKTLIWLRTQVVLDSTSAEIRPYRPVLRKVAIPVLLYQLLISIGEAYDKEFNIKFYPACTIAKEELLSVDEFAAVSQLFLEFEDEGMKVVYGMPREVEGELDFMAMSHVNDEIVSYKSTSHPCYAFLAAFCRQKQLNEITGRMSRVVYGYESDFRYELRALMKAIQG